jgi:uncharacterized membrane protein HdeD (DUF308 family)
MTAADITTDLRVEALSALLARNWWAEALRGVAAILFGLVALFEPGVTLLSLVIVFAALMVVDGVLSLIAGVRSARQHERWWTLVLLGIASLVAAAIAVMYPGLTVVAFVYLMAAWAVVSGVLAVVAAVRLRHDHGRWWLGFSGALSVVAGIALGVAPIIGAIVLTWWLGAYAIVFGATLLVLAFRLRARRHGALHAATPHPA